MNEDSGSAGVLWFIAGAALGASVGLLFAPASGEETRKAIVRKTGEGRSALKGSGREMLDRGREMFEEARRLTEEAADLFEKGRKLVEETAAHLDEN